jgi:hypothetical protein
MTDMHAHIEHTKKSKNLLARLLCAHGLIELSRECLTLDIELSIT